jgi:hypothetical protein
MRPGEPASSSRRRFLRWLIRIGAGAFAVALLLPALALQTLTRNRREVANGDLLVFASGDQAGTPIRADASSRVKRYRRFPKASRTIRTT